MTSNSINTENKTIHVCFVSLTAYPLFNPTVEKNHGGAEVDVYMLATELARDNRFKISLVAGDYNQPKVEVINGITTYKSVDLQKHPVAATVSIYKAMQEADADIYFRKGASLITVVVGLFCRIKNRLFVYRSSHTNHCDGTYLRENWFRGRLFKWAVKQAAVALVQNRTDIQPLKQTIGVDSIVIRNGHNIDEVEERERDSVLWVGRTARFKKPELFVRLAKEFENEKCVMVCSRSPERNDYEELGLQQAANIEFHEQVPFNEIDYYFERAKVFVSTSDSEGFPNTFIQACKAATPILSLNVNPDGFLDEYNCGQCCNGNWQRFTESLHFMLQEQRYLQLGRNARTYVEEKHDIKKIVQQYKELLIKITEERGRGILSSGERQ